MYEDIGHSLGTDYFLIADQLTREELGYLRRTRDFVDNEVLPVINGYWERKQFGKPLVSFQIVQDRLVKMLAEVCSMQLYCLRLGRLIQEGRLTDTIAALAKMNNTRKARQVIFEARDLLGGNGMMRHMADIEAIHTYEGTETIQTLIVGRDITSVSAFT
jgi:alkylation response protein AidB-like acyl-CoA dehydrogenase